MVQNFHFYYWQAGVHALHAAATEGNTEIAKTLLQAGVTIDEVIW